MMKKRFLQSRFCCYLMVLAVGLSTAGSCNRSGDVESAVSKPSRPDSQTSAGDQSGSGATALPVAGSAEEHPNQSAELTPDFSLPETTQKYLRDIEHLVLVVDQDVLAEFRTVIRKGTSARLSKFLSPQFEALVFETNGTTLALDPISAELWDEDSHDRNRLDGQAFIEQLATYGENFGVIDGISFHVTTMSPEVHGDLSGGWRVAWDMHVTGQLKNGSLAEHTLNCSVRFKRFNEDIAKTDGWITNFIVNTASFTATQHPLMEEITNKSGIDVDALPDNWKKPGPPYTPITVQARMLDFDRDGWADLLLTEQPRSHLYRGLGQGRFQDVTAAAGLTVSTEERLMGCLVADLNNDRFEDLFFIVNFAVRNQKGQPVLKRRVDVYENLQDGTFRRLLPTEHNLSHFEFSLLFRATALADFDGDGLIDIYAGLAGPKPTGQVASWINDQTSKEGLLLKNLGNWQFANISQQAGVTGEYLDVFATLCLDVEPDGDADIFLANHMGNNLLWENQGDGTFTKRMLNEGFGGFSMGATSGDLDSDGDPDLYLANMYSAAGSRIIGNLREEDYPPGAFQRIEGFVTGNELYQNRERGDFFPIGVTARVANTGWAYGPGLVDLNGDGKLDIYSPAGFQSVTRGKPDG